MQASFVPPGPDFVPTLPNLLRKAAERFGSREFLVLGQQRLSFMDAESISAALAKGLIAMGVGKGTRIGLLMPNTPDWVTCFLASSRAGALTVTLSTFYQPPELSWALRFNDIDTLLIGNAYLHHDYIDRLEQAIPELSMQPSSELFLTTHPYLRRVVVWGECDRAWATKGPVEIVRCGNAKPKIDDAFLRNVEANIAPADLLLTICTSGTTAEPKAVVHTHGTALRAVFSFLDYIDVRPDDRTYTGQALFWIGGHNVGLLPALYNGSCLCFSETPHPRDIASVIQAERVTRLTLWPAQTIGILEAAKQENIDLSSVRSGLASPRDEQGVVISPERRLGGTLGMTESFGMHSIEKLTSAMPLGKAGNFGRRVPGVERIVVDAETGEWLGAGQKGRLFIRGYTLMSGYYKRDREETFTRDGFFDTGDIASIDEDDYLYFHGRATDAIKTAGANVSPQEVELALLSLPHVREAIVFGLPDAERGEIVAAVLVAEDQEMLNLKELRTLLQSKISSYKIPRLIRCMEYTEIPRTGSQKPIKARLKEILVEAHQLAAIDRKDRR